MALLKTLDSAFRTTCKVVLGQDIGSLEEWGPWLSEYSKKPAQRESRLSKRPVYAASRHYSPGAQFIHFDEINFGAKFEPLSINEMKDIEGIIEALGERICYSGSVVLGNSKEVEGSANVTDSFYVLNSNSIWKGKYLAYSSYSKDSSYLFGTHDTAESENLLRCICDGGPNGVKRAFESSMVSTGADMYYSYHMQGCSDCMFSFFQRGKRHMIGNRQLPKEKYLSIKKSLLGQVVGELLSKKRSISFIDLFRKAKEEPAEEEREGFDVSELNKAFNSTSKVLLGQELGGVDDYGGWLTSGLDYYDLKFVKSAVSGKPVPAVKEYYGFTSGIRYMSIEELEGASKKEIPSDETTSIHELEEKMREIVGYCAYFNVNCRKIDCPVICAETWNSRKCIMPVLSKNTAYSFWPRESVNIFGSSIAFNCSFVIRGVHCSNVTRGFEVDASSNSSDIYFSHNVENAGNCMFCFNAKNLRNAIGNAQLPSDKFQGVKSSIVEQIAGELLKKKSFKWSIYNIGAGR